jgi:8-oxo-dGTP diphosphatase
VFAFGENAVMAVRVLDTVTVPWISTPHRMDVLLSDGFPIGHTITTAFVLALDCTNRTLLTRVDLPGRGWEVPGGHLDPGEDPHTAAVRELAEETGLTLSADQVTLIGGQQITMLTSPPAGYPYPSRTFMAFYTVRLSHPGAPTHPHPDSECGQAEWITREEMDKRCPTATWRPLHAALLR